MEQEEEELVDWEEGELREVEEDPREVIIREEEVEEGRCK